MWDLAPQLLKTSNLLYQNAYMAIKLGRMVTYHETLPLIKSYNRLIKLKILYPHYYSAYDQQNWDRVIPTHKVTAHFDHAVL